MYRVIRRSESPGDEPSGSPQPEVLDTVVLPYAIRQKGRFLATSSTGLEVGVFLVRGEVLRCGDVLHTECGQTFRVEAQEEAVVTAECSDWLMFSKACYHLGNRHVPMAIGERWLRFQPDHVLEVMLDMMGLVCRHHQAVFTPESGAYHGMGQVHHQRGHDHHDHLPHPPEHGHG